MAIIRTNVGLVGGVAEVSFCPQDPVIPLVLEARLGVYRNSSGRSERKRDAFKMNDVQSPVQDNCNNCTALWKAGEARHNQGHFQGSGFQPSQVGLALKTLLAKCGSISTAGDIALHIFVYHPWWNLGGEIQR